MKKKFKKIVIISIIAVISTSILSFSFYDDGDDFEIAKSLDIFHTLVREIRMLYVDETDIGKLINESMEGMLKTLDPYTIYYPESQMEDFRFMSTGAYGGIGADIIENDNKLIITDIHDNSPSFRKDIYPGDVIYSINNQKVTKDNILEVRELLKGEPGSKVKIEIERYGFKNKIIKEVLREKIIIKNIEYSGIVGNSLGYIKLKNFRVNAANDFKKAFDNLNNNNQLNGLIIDLRGNPGGLLIESVKIVNFFVEKGSKIVNTKGKMAKWNKSFNAVSEPIDTEIPIVVLVNSSSASASEIVSGALQDLDRAVIVGQRTFGKGLVQTTRDLSYKTKLKITTAKYYIPSGRCIQAIDYANRNNDGSVGKVPDSLISEFKTLRGRKVYDGGGVAPDIEVKKKKMSSLTFNLLTKHVIFDYATKYFYNHKNIPEASNFVINENLYSEFIQFSKSENLNYETDSEFIINELEQSVNDEQYDNKVIETLKLLEKQIEESKRNDYIQFKKEIIPYLKNEICSRYYRKQGRILSSFIHDDILIKGKQILSNISEYDKILLN